MKKTLLLLLPIYLLLASFMQSDTPCSKLQENNILQQQGDSIYLPATVDSLPVFPGGDNAIASYLQSNIVYPPKAKADTISGTVYVSYVIWSDGSVGRVYVKRSAHELLDREAVRLVKAMPNWKPAEINNVPVACEMIFPIRFVLR
ncbi:MAG: energy transducer TonB [Bacteroidota bacterium]|jgi:protein TonB